MYGTVQYRTHYVTFNKLPEQHVHVYLVGLFTDSGHRKDEKIITFSGRIPKFCPPIRKSFNEINKVKVTWDWPWTFVSQIEIISMHCLTHYPLNAGGKYYKEK